MEDKKKVKSIKSSDDNDYKSTKTSKTKDASISVKDAYLQEIEEFDTRGEVLRRRVRAIVFILIAIIVIIGILSYFSNGKITTPNLGISNTKITDKGVNGSVSKIYDATVYIQNYSSNQVSNTGTGFIYKKDRTKGYILTNYHVVSGSDSLKVTLSDDNIVDAKFLGGDQYSDIAILSIPAKNVKAIATMGASTKVAVGDTVFVVGSPINNDYRGTVTKGILSGKNRLVSISTGNSDYYSMKLLQTDASINPGNSGSPLCNSNGEVIGMISTKVAKDKLEGLGFAISIEDIKGKISSYEKGTASSKPYLGISMVNLSDSSSMSYYGLSSKVNTNLTQGVVVENIKKNSPATGVLRVGDIIISMNDVQTVDMAHLRYELYNHNIGEKIKLSIERDGTTKNVTVILGEKKSK